MVNVSGTGSNPPQHNGWHRAIRQIARIEPRHAPKRAIDTLA
jgi:hypothetical protein